MVEKIYMLIYVFSTLIIALATLITGKTYGEARNVNLSSMEIILLSVVYIGTIMVFYLMYLRTKSKIPSIKGFPRFNINLKRLHIVVCGALILKLIGAVVFGVGKVFATVETSFSFVFAIIKIEEFFLIYYICGRRKSTTIYWINVILFGILKTISGWTSWILTIGIIELYLQFKNKGKIYKLLIVFKTQMITIFAMLIGGLFYYLIYPIKLYMRYGGKVSFYEVSYVDAFIKLIERFTNFPVFTSAFKNIELMKVMYVNQGEAIAEFKSIFKTLLPSFLMQNKDFRILGNIVTAVMWPGLDNRTSTGYGFVAYWYSIFKCSILDFILCSLAMIAFFFLTCSILRAFDNKEHEMNILYFIFLMSIALGSSVQQVFSYGYIGSIYMILILFLFGAIKIKKEIYV